MATDKIYTAYGNSFLRFLARSGVPFEEARWLHLKMVGGGVSTAADLNRLQSILDLDQEAQAILFQVRISVPEMACV
jgi:hypothetical protein